MQWVSEAPGGKKCLSLSGLVIYWENILVKLPIQKARNSSRAA
jgi:hypothetical protein